MSLELNQFVQAPVLGMTDMKFNFNTMSVQVDSSETGEIVAGQAVVVVDNAGGVPKVVAASANDDKVWGFVNYDIKSQKFVASNAMEVSTEGNVLFLLSTGAIGRGAQVTLDVSVAGGVAAAVTGDRLVGYALDKASASGALIRVRLYGPHAALA
jgi:hypothetical protein